MKVITAKKQNPNIVEFSSLKNGTVFYKREQKFSDDYVGAERSVYMKVGVQNCTGTNAITLKTGSKSHMADYEQVYLPDAIVLVAKSGEMDDNLIKENT